jgi:hypothetical protein
MGFSCRIDFSLRVGVMSMDFSIVLQLISPELVNTLVRAGLFNIVNRFSFK